MSAEGETPKQFGERAEVPRPADAKPASEALRPEPAPAAQPLPSANAPPPVRSRSRRSRNQFVVFLNFLISCIVLLTIAAGIAFYFGKTEFNGRGPSTRDTTFIVKPNSHVQDIADDLESRGLISDARIFSMGVRAHGNQGKLKAGEYAIKAGASMREIMDLLRSGRSIMYSLTIPEGLTVEQALQRVAADDALSGDMPPPPPEGSLATDTQRFTRGTSRKEVIGKMMAGQKALVTSIWQKRQDNLPLKDVNDFVTLASIVEKETGKAEERPHVAAVFLNRLKKGMRLQSDPTIIYGLFGGKGRPADRPIYQSDKEKPTPYNTYVINGLPPTPIANPGRASLEAVANPLQTDDLYFVADGTGGHVFAATLAEHNQNVAKWRAIQKKQKTENGEAGSSADTTQDVGPDTKSEDSGSAD